MKKIPFALAIVVWLAGFVVLRQSGSTVVLQGGAVGLAGWLMIADAETRALLNWKTTSVFIGLLAGAGMIAATYVGYPIILKYWPPMRAQVLDLETLLFAHKTRLAVLGVVLPMSICEEILFRGSVLGATKGRGGLSVALAAILYAVAHLTSGSGALIFLAFGCGVVWGWLRYTTGSLWASIVCHVAWDLTVMVFFPLH